MADKLFKIIPTPLTVSEDFENDRTKLHERLLELRNRLKPHVKRRKLDPNVLQEEFTEAYNQIQLMLSPGEVEYVAYMIDFVEGRVVSIARGT